MSTTSTVFCPKCHSFPCQCVAAVNVQPTTPYIDPFVLIRIALALERIADALDSGAAEGDA